MIFERNNPQFDCILCLNGKISKEIINLKNLIIIAADGAFNKLIKYKIKPNTVIGDFDSIKKIYLESFPEISFIHKPSQEKNDFEKCLDFCLENSLDNILIFGFNGGKLEHILNNVSVLKKYSNRLNLFFYDKNRLGLIVSDNFKLDSYIDELITLIPLPKAKITTKNLKWQLNNEYLEIGKRDGLSNRSKSNFIEINCYEGMLIIFFDYTL